jgi:hypothetical protein
MKNAQKLLYLITSFCGIILLTYFYAKKFNNRDQIQSSFAVTKIVVFNENTAQQKIIIPQKANEILHELESLIYVQKILSSANSHAVESRPSSLAFSATFSTIKDNEIYILELWLDKYGRLLSSQTDNANIEKKVNNWLFSEASELFDPIPYR